MTDEEFILFLDVDDDDDKWIVSNKHLKNNGSLLTKNITFISLEDAIKKTFNNYPGILLYYKNESPIYSPFFEIVLSKISYLWTDMSKQNFYDFVFFPIFNMYEDKIFNFFKNKLELSNIVMKNYIGLSREHMNRQLLKIKYNKKIDNGK
jgi:hypothetical protein